MRLLSDRLLGARAAAVNQVATTCGCVGNVRLVGGPGLDFQTWDPADLRPVTNRESKFPMSQNRDMGHPAKLLNHLPDRLGAVRNRSKAPYLTIRLRDSYRYGLGMDIQT
jgi:hypothetical protein